MTRILFPTDFSPAAGHAFGYALMLAERLGAEILFFHAYSLTTSADMLAPVEIIQALRAAEENRALAYLEAYQAGIQAESQRAIAITPLLRTGYPAEAIVAVAEELKPDLIVMGTQGATHRLDVLLGSATTQVIQEAKVPVLAVPAQASWQAVHRIGLATDLKEGPSPHLIQLGHLARALAAEIHCVHIARDVAAPQLGDLLAAERWYRQETGYERVHLHLVPDSQVAPALGRFMAEQQIDLLAVTTHRRSLLQRLLHPSLTRKLALESRIPLLAFHDS